MRGLPPKSFPGGAATASDRGLGSVAELNAAPCCAPRQRVRFLPAPARGDGETMGLVAVSVPVLADHPLGKSRRGASSCRESGSPAMMGVSGRRCEPAPTLSPLQFEARGSSD